MTHNQIDYQSLKETMRHNREMESQGAQSLAETTRHNRAYEQETNRANLVNESERSRSNLANEMLKHESNILNYNASMAATYESIRHNTAVERETKRANQRREFIDHTHNTNVERETKRHNVSNENAQTFSNITSYETSNKSAVANLINADVASKKAPSEALRNIGSAVNSLSNASLNQVKSLREVFGTMTDLVRIGKIGGK